MFWQEIKVMITIDFRKLYLTVKTVMLIHKRIEIIYITSKVVEGEMECEKINK